MIATLLYLSAALRSVSLASFSTKPPRRVLGELGGSVLLDWQFSNDGANFVKWYRTDERNTPITTITYIVTGKNPQITDEYKGRVTNDGRAQLTIDNLKWTDEGLIACVVDFNGGETIFDRVYLEIGTKPHDTTIPAKYVSTENLDFEMSCSTSGKPAPNITWVYNNSVLTNSSHYNITEYVIGLTNFETQVESTLSLNNVQRSDDGLYLCRAANFFADEDVETTMEVQYKPINTQLLLQFASRLEGDANKLTCTAEGLPTFMNYEFYFEDNLLRSTTDNVYSINSVKNYDEGKYKCVPRNAIGAGIEKTVDMKVDVRPYAFGLNPSMIAVEDDPVDVKCSFRGHPTPTVTWKKTDAGNADILNFDTSTILDNATLSSVESVVKIRPSKRTDYGVYTCTATNEHGEAKQTVKLAINYNPFISVNSLQQPNFFVFENSNKKETCIAKGLPKPLFKWYRDNVEITNNGKHSIVEKVKNSAVDVIEVESTLTLNSLTKHDAGVLKCEATNEVGTASEETKLNVYYKPEITAQMDEKSYVNLATGLTLTCVAKSIEQSTFFWYKNDVLIVDNTGNNQIDETKWGTTFSSSSLLINPITNADSNAVIKCQANNTLGIASKETLVTVYFAPKITEFPNTTITTFEGNREFRVTCSLRGNPKPAISWLKNGEDFVFDNTKYLLEEEIIESSSIITIIKSTVVIAGVGRLDYGNWTCRGSNTIANDMFTSVEKTTWLTVTYSPSFEFLPPNPFRVNISETVIFICRVKASPKPFVWWKLPTGLQSDNRFSYSSEIVPDETEFGSIDVKMTITETTKEEYGVYQCLTNNTFVSRSESLQLVIQYAPTVTSSFPRPEYFVPEGSIASMALVVDANPPPTITWYLQRTANYDPIVNNIQTEELAVIADYENKIESRYYFPSGRLLRTDQTSYKVHIKNLLGVVDVITDLIVQWRPEIETKIPVSKNALLNEKLSFICRYYSNPASVINWFKDGMPVNEIGYNTAILEKTSLSTLSQSTLTFLSVKVSDRANYSCTANNTFGIETQYQYLNVLYPPRLLVNSSFKIANEKSTLILSCSSDGNPPVTQYLWKKNNVTMNRPSEYLRIADFQRSSQGFYSCTPMNSQGMGDTVVYNVTLAVHPFFTIRAICDKTTVQSLVTYKCRCYGSGHPHPEVFWRKYSSTKRISEANHLNVTSSRGNDGTYYCHLRNSKGEAVSLYRIADFIAPYGSWNQWSTCNTTCGDGSRLRTRACNLPPCVVPLTEFVACSGECAGKQIGDATVNWMYALYALIPCIVLLIVVAITCVVRVQRYGMVIAVTPFINYIFHQIAWKTQTQRKKQREEIRVTYTPLINIYIYLLRKRSCE